MYASAPCAATGTRRGCFSMACCAQPERRSHWEAVSVLLDELLDADTAQQSVRLNRLETEQPLIAHSVRDMLARRPFMESELFLEGCALDFLPAPASALEQLGDYTAERLLAQGGMSTV